MKKTIALAVISLSVVVIATGCAVQPSVGMNADLIVARGLVYDGELSAPRVADVVVRGDRIVYVGADAARRYRAARVIDAHGLLVAPGFIDAHVHAEPELDSTTPAARTVERQLLQGVTTSVIGVDGAGTPAVGAQLARYERDGVGQNVATYVGFGAVRMQVLGESARAPTAPELVEMRRLVAQGMCEGALGLSSGLFYAPQSFAKTDEVIALAREAGLRGGLYDTHQRDEGDSNVGVLPSLDEAIRIGRESGAPLHLAHIKISGAGKPGAPVMAQLIAAIDAARAAGQPVTADQYPWTAANTGLESAVIPRWAQDGGREAMLKRFGSPADAARIRAEAKLPMALAQRIMVNNAPGQAGVLGKRLSDLATAWSVTPIDAAMRLLTASEVSVAVFVMSEADVRAAMIQPWVMTSSDGRSGGHPRAYASYPKLWADYVRMEKILSPQQFVHRSTALVADTFGLADRGRIRVGAFADIGVFDPARFMPRATFAEPRLLAEGMRDVIVNGRLEVDGGRTTGVLAGRGLRKAPKAGTCG